MPRYSEQDKARALEQLREWLKPGTTVNTISRHTSRSGMSRSISLVIAGAGGEMIELDYHASRAMGDSIDQKHGGIRIGGCGMDMGFALVYNLSSVLFPDGYGCVGERCPSNDHSNGDRSYTPHAVGVPMLEGGKIVGFCMTEEQRKSGACVHWHKSGGYALRHRWM